MTDLDLPDLLGGPVPGARSADQGRQDAHPDPLAGTDVARIPIPAGITGFGFGELRYLLARQDSPASRRTAERLGLDETDGAQAVLAAGVSSLLARGLVAVDEAGHARSCGEAALLETLFATGRRWTGVAYHVGPRIDLLVLVEGEGVVGMLQVRQYGTWFVGLTAQTADPAGLVATAVAEMAARHGPGRFGVNVRTLAEDLGARYLVAEPAGGWRVAATREGEDVLMTCDIETATRWALADLDRSTAPRPSGDG